jgi:uncharacterized phage protein (TIGR01671 family)
MNRQIKFRGRRVRDGKWTYGWLVVEDNGTAWISRYYHRGEWEQVDPATVGQFTGILDKNGAEIYEGDIVGMVANGTTGPREIEFKDGAFGVKALKASDELWFIEVWHMDVKVIGNIHDNPDLLGGSGDE